MLISNHHTLPAASSTGNGVHLSTHRTKPVHLFIALAALHITDTHVASTKGRTKLPRQSSWTQSLLWYCSLACGVVEIQAQKPTGKLQSPVSDTWTTIQGWISVDHLVFWVILSSWGKEEVGTTAWRGAANNDYGDREVQKPRQPHICHFL